MALPRVFRIDPTFLGGNGAPALDLRLAGASALDGRITFTRASTGTYFNSAGLLATASSGAARFTYDPATLTALGLLIEESRTNLALQSNAFGTTWTLAGTGGQAIAGAAGVSPDGSNNAWKLTENNTTVGAHGVQQTMTLTSGVSYTFSIYVKAAERSQVEIQYFDGTANAFPVFNLTDGTVANANGATSTTAQNVGNGWWRLSVTKTSAGTAGQVDIYTASGNTNSYAGTIGSGVLIYGAQLEQATFPSTYIPTTTAAVTRAADVATMTLASIGVPANPAGLTIIGKARPAVGVNGNQVMASVTDGTNNNRIQIARTVSRGASLFIAAGGVTQTNSGSGTIADSTDFTIWDAQQTNDFAFQVTGNVKATGSSLAMPTGLTTITIGDAGVGGSRWNSTIARLQIYNRRLGDAQAAAIASAM